MPVMPQMVVKRAPTRQPVAHQRRSLGASLLFHTALVLWLGVIAPLAYQAAPEKSIDEYVTQVTMMNDYVPEPQIKERLPDPPTPPVPEILEEETPPEELTEVVSEVRVEAAPQDLKLERLAEPAKAVSFSEVKLKFKPAPAPAPAPAGLPLGASGLGATGMAGLGGSPGIGNGIGDGPRFVQVNANGPGTGNGTAPVATGPSTGTGVGRRARLKSEINPPYPESKRREGQMATVTLLVTVGINGKAQEVKVLTEAVSREFVDAAVCAAQCAKYEPALENGRPIASNLRLSIRFVLQ